MTKEELRLEFVSYCGKTGIGSVLMMNELFLAFDWFYSKLTQSKEEAVKEEREICRQIFIDEVDWAEWSMSEIDAGKEFDEARASLTKTEGKE